MGWRGRWHCDELMRRKSNKTLEPGESFEINVDIPSISKELRYFAGAADKIHGKTLKLSSQFQGYTLLEPIGVVGHIIPWNFPSAMFVLKCAPALAAGCTMVIKPAEQAPLSALYLAHLAKKVAATSNLKTVSLELGGKSPLIIFDDSNVDQASDLALFGSLANKVDKKQYEKVLSYIDQGKREGASLLIVGKPCRQKGYYIEPTIFENVKDDMLIAKDEIFGPVMSLMKFKTVEEAIGSANVTAYGLAARIVTNDLNIANRVSRSIRAGIIWINCYHNFDSGCPIGGYKMSGFGKDHGMESLEKYLQTKAVVTPI
ncbi:hypothetical protein L1987_20822 [Smallanthus sonchifolius]|uniref:Uncharacterized protein n=1 Tax=Smallanthus sonchifolius TaxID=185202 RepID=A0ACB9IUD2_9ASTR|nr:hypothetical protein L1987_20822 [Smallanthus sonchifolius]